jgi:hypothetical protein
MTLKKSQLTESEKEEIQSKTTEFVAANNLPLRG